MTGPILSTPGDLAKPSASGRPAGQSRLAPAELCLAVVICAGLFALHCLYALHLHFNSDESQHLHVVWGWTVGLRQYRDVFDNHTPLFHILLSPILRLVGERADALIPMRFAMFPLWIGSLAAVYRTFAHAYSRSIGLWAAVFAAAAPAFFLKMTEFRTDVLWTMLWLISIAVLVSGPPTARRFLVAGLTLGAALSVSMKTTLLLATLAIAGIVLLVFQYQDRIGPRLRNRLPALGALLAGLCIVPAILLAWFAAKGDLHPLYYCIVEHNKLPGMGLFHRAKYHLWLIGLGSSTLVFLARYALRMAPDRQTGLNRAFILLATGFYYIALEGFWPMITFQDYMPFDPLFAAGCAVPALFAGDWLAVRLSRPSVRLLPVCLLLLLAFARIGVGFSAPSVLKHFALDNPWEDGTVVEIKRVGDTLKLTQPGELVMDGKGETIFRPRTFYYVLEILTQKRMDLGLIKDDIIQRLIDTRTAVLHQPRLPLEDEKFVEANYVSIGALSVLGKELPTPQDGIIPFEVSIPETYSIVAGLKDVPGILDGLPLNGSRFLEAGAHSFQPAHLKGAPTIHLFLTRAHEKGYVPLLSVYAGGAAQQPPAP